MCGIAGILHYNTLPSAREMVESMTAVLTHRGPDNTSHLHLPAISLGHTRLSIVDLSDAANQPFADASGRYILLFNGEIYNYLELKHNLSDYPFATTSDTEVVIAAFSKWGIECIHHLHGMFAFTVWDKQTETLWLARDRFGTKPLLIHQGQHYFLFGSERRALMASGLISREMGESGLFDYLSYQSSGYPDTIIKDIKVVPPGAYMKVHKNGSVTTRYWNFSHIQSDPHPDSDQLQTTLLDKLHQAVTSRCIGDVPMGVFLSGGLDSSAVTALMSMGSVNTINSFHLSVKNQNDRESVYAELIAKKFQTNHHNYEIEKDEILQKISEGLNVMDSPTMDGINTYIVSSIIRDKGFKVALSGIGGDELFGGYPGFKHFLLLNNRKGIYDALKSIRKLSSIISSFGSSNLMKRYSSLLAVNNVSIEELYPVLRQVLAPSTIRELTALQSSSSNLQSILSTSKTEFAHLELMSQYSIAELLGYAHNTLLRDADQMGMSVSLEIREPLFDHRLVEFILSVPDIYKNTQRPKQLLFDTLEPMLPQEIFYRPKKGFVLPWDEWMRNELYTLCEKQIYSIAQRPQFNAFAVRSLWKNFINEDPRVRWTDVWLFVVLGNWLEKNQVQ